MVKIAFVLVVAAIGIMFLSTCSTWSNSAWKNAQPLKSFNDPRIQMPDVTPAYYDKNGVH